MSFRFEEITGGSLTLQTETTRRVRRFRATDTIPTGIVGNYFDFVATYANAYVANNAPTYSTPRGTLYANTIELQENYYAQRYEISVTYGPQERMVGTYQLTVDGTGGTVHVVAGTRVSGWGPSGGGYDSSFGVPSGSGQSTEPTSDEKVDHGGLIGVDGDDVRGVDIPVDQTKITVMFRHPQGVLIPSYVKAIGKLTGYPNSDSFLTYDPGEVLFTGPLFTETNVEATALYNFIISYNAFNIEVGGITIGEKFGWDIISPTYKTTEDNNKKVRQLEYIEIIRPAGRDWKPYAATFGWGAT